MTSWSAAVKSAYSRNDAIAPTTEVYCSTIACGFAAFKYAFFNKHLRAWGWRNGDGSSVWGWGAWVELATEDVNVAVPEVVLLSWIFGTCASRRKRGTIYWLPVFIPHALLRHGKTCAWPSFSLIESGCSFWPPPILRFFCLHRSFCCCNSIGI